ncbi:MAG: hypothetical protein AAGB31_11560, partial [Bdellovibrio sp.]
QQQPAQPQVQQPVYIQQVPVQQVTEPKENTRDIVREEIAAAMKVEEDAAVKPLESKYVGGILGVGSYPDVRNVKGNYALGVAFGSKVDAFILEGSFLFSNYTVEDQGYYAPGYGYGYGYGYNSNYVMDTIDVKQYTGSLAAKVQLFDGIIKPVFGGLVAYSYRAFSWDNTAYYGNQYYNDTKASSHAIDLGALVGADLEFSPKYSLGVDFRYMWNLSNRVNAGNSPFARPQYGNSIEKQQYYVMSVVGRVNF